MPQRENNGDRFKRLRRAASRRKFMSTVLAASVGGLAGCSGGGGGGTDTEGDDPTATPTESDDGSMTPGDGTDTDTGTPTPTRGEPQSTTIGHHMATAPQNSNANRYAENSAINNSGVGWMFEMTLPFQEGQSRVYTSGHTWDLPDMGEVEVHTWLEDYELEAPFDWWETYDDETTYWDGTPMDANARRQHEEIGYYAEGAGRFGAGDEGFEQLSDWEMHFWNPRGEAEGVTAQPSNQFSLESNVGMYEPPPHPDFTSDWAQAAIDASSEEEATELWTGEIQSRTLSYAEMADKGWGSGLYRADGQDAVTDQAVLLTAREDHPNHRDRTVPEIRLETANNQRRQTLLNEGEIDIEHTVIGESGPVTRDSLPGYIQQLSTFPATAMNGFPFNWDGHLGNLWVRRALIEAVDWVAIAANAMGPNSFYLPNYHTGLLNAMNNVWFDDDFLNSLHQWSNRDNMSTAEEYMERAGYSKSGGTWESPEGDNAELLIKASAGYGQVYVTVAQALQQQLNDFGFDVEFQNQSTSAVNTSRDNMSYDIVYWWNNMSNPWDAYTSSTGWWNPKVVERDPDFPNSEDGWSDSPNGRSPDPEDVTNDEGEVVDPADTHDLRSMPLEVDLPTEVGDMSAPDFAGPNPSLEGVTDYETINLIELLIEFHGDPEITADRVDEVMRKMAWFYNYYLPDFWAVQGSAGVIGNVQDFDFVEQGHDVYSSAVRTGGFSDQYQTHSGLVREKYDDEYTEPDA